MSHIFLAPFSSSAANNPPHVPEKGINCDSCHLPATDPVWAVGTDPDPDQNDPYNRICWTCHNDSSAPFKKTHSSTAVNSSKYGDWRWKCTDCHNPHQQRQVYFNQYVSGLTGTISAVNAATKTFTLSISLPARPNVGDGTNTNDYVGWTIVPNRTYRTINYKISANAGNTVTVTTDVQTARVPLNSSFGILPGRLLKDVIYTPPPGNAKNARLLALEGANSFAHNDGLAGGQDSTPDGVCQICHGIRPEGAGMTRSRANGTGFGDGHPTDTAANCTGCHDHSSTGFGASCSSCHGYPPVDGASLVSNPLPTGSTTAGAHAKHATSAGMNYSCDTCHYNGMPATPIAGNARIQIGFNMFGGAYTGVGTTYRGQTLINGFSYEFTNGTAQGSTTSQCSNIYCHGATMDVAGDRNGGSNITPLWNTPATGACGTCHGSTASNPPFRGSHRTHVMNDTWSYAPNTDPPFNNYIYGRNMGCSVCHNQYSAVHVNGAANWSFDTGTIPWLAGAKYKGASSGSTSPVPGTYGQCSNLYCHSIVQTSTGGPLTGTAGEYTTPTWGNRMSGNCGSCHNADEGHSYWAGRGMGAPEIDSGSHTKHLQNLTVTVGGGANGPGRCGACHNYVGSDNLLGCASVCHNRNELHVDHRIDVLFPPRYGTTASYNGTPQPGDGYGICSNVYCHGSTLPGGTNKTPAWGGTAVCGDCHYASFPLSVTSPPTGRSHMRHTGTLSRQQGMVCSDCHGANGAGGTDHIDAKIQWNLNTAKAGTGAQYRGAVSGAVNNPAPSATYGQCSIVYCHSNVQPNGGTGAPDQYFTPTWGDAAVATCEACHKAASGDNHGSYSTIATGSHSKHLTYTFTSPDRSRICAICHVWNPSETLADSCTFLCHARTSSKHADYNVDVAIIRDFNPGSTAAYSGTPAPGDGYGNCANTYCHGDGTSVSTGSVTANTSPIWGAGSLSCSSCHGYGPSYTSGSPKANSHQGMQAGSGHSRYTCNVCHADTTSDGVTISNRTKHVNTTYDVTPDIGYSFTYTYASTGGSCANGYCHSNVQPDGGTGSPDFYATPQWGNNVSVACGSCHKTDLGHNIFGQQMSSGGHAKHLAYEFGTLGSHTAKCMICHTLDSAGNDCDACHSPTALAKHANGNVDIGFRGAFVSGATYGGTPAPGDGYGACSNTYCHGDGTSVSTGNVAANSSPAWGVAGPLACDACHGFGPSYASGSPKANSHVRHVTERGIACDRCHWRTTQTGTTITDTSKHVNGTYDVGNSAGSITFAFSASGGSCSGTFGCHGNATWGSTIPAPSYANCISCHSAPMNSRRQIVDTNGDGTGVGGDFKKTSHHHYAVSGTITNADCQVCHDTAQHPGGSVRLKNADTGEVYTYNPADPATAENHCLSCHDTDGANGNMAPFSDGKTLGAAPYRAGIDIKSNWNKTYGHRQQGLTCLGNGAPNTGCHAGGHGSDYVGLLSRNLTLPNPSTAYYSAADEGSYDICFTCHQSFPRVTKEAVMGYRSGGNYDLNGEGPPPYNLPNILTMFRDRNGQGSGKPYDNPLFWTSLYTNLHYYHLQSGGWSYRGTTGSSLNCIACHNVHGSNTLSGWTYDEMQYTRYTGTGSDLYGTMDVADYALLGNYPTNCTFNCHTIQGKTHNWFTPADE